MDLYDHGGQQRTPGQIPYLSLAKVMIILELPPTAGKHQLPIPPLPADPKTKALARFIELMPVHPVPRPLQDFREIVVCHLDSLAQRPDRGKARQINAFTDSCGEPKRDWGTLTRVWIPHDKRDQIVDFVRRWSEASELGIGRFIGWLGVTASKLYSWRERYGCANEDNDRVPRDFWLEDWEKQAIIGFHPITPQDWVSENDNLVWAKGRPVACVAWSSAPRHIGARDRYIDQGDYLRIGEFGVPKLWSGQMVQEHEGPEPKAAV